MNKLLLAALLAALLPAVAGAASQNYRIDHMDPPLWWTGMHNSKLQLMASITVQPCKLICNKERMQFCRTHLLQVDFVVAIHSQHYLNSAHNC